MEVAGQAGGEASLIFLGNDRHEKMKMLHAEKRFL